MNRYKPEVMGKVMPADNQQELTQFMMSQYDAFCRVWDACKDFTPRIDTVDRVVEATGNFSIQVSTDSVTLKEIREAASDDMEVTVSGVITARV